MKISKSKQELARIISENGGWREMAKFSAQDKDGDVYHFATKPTINAGHEAWHRKGCIGEGEFTAETLPNWHQTILSREEYFRPYPEPDTDGWIEWSGGECPVEGSSIVDVEFNDGRILSGLAISFSWLHEWVSGNIIKYRKHKKPKAQPECPGKINPIIPASIDELCAKVTEENKNQHVDAKPTIEQLAQDYRNKLDFAKRKQQEADDAKADANEALRKLEIAGEAIGLIVTPITAKKEDELVIEVKVDDEVECVESNIKRDKYNGMVGRLRTIDESDTSTPYLVDFGGEEKIWCHKVKFIRRP